MRVDHVARSILAVALAIIAAGSLSAASKSPAADAVMKGDKAALRAVLQQKADVDAPQGEAGLKALRATFADVLG